MPNIADSPAAALPLQPTDRLFGERAGQAVQEFQLGDITALAQQGMAPAAHTHDGLMTQAQSDKLAALPTASALAADQAAQDQAISSKADASHTHTAAQISDAGAAGRELLRKETLPEIQALVSGVLTADGKYYIGPAFGPASPISQMIVRDATSPDPNNALRSAFELQHDAASAYIFHLTQGPNMGPDAYLIGLGGDAAGGCLYINNKVTGKGLHIRQRPTITSPIAFGMLVDCGEGVAPGACFSQDPLMTNPAATSYSTAVVFRAVNAIDGNQKLVEFQKPNGLGTGGTTVGFVKSIDGQLVWGAKTTITTHAVGETALAVNGLAGQTAPLQTWYNPSVGVPFSIGADGFLTVGSVLSQTAQANIGIYDTSGTAGQRRYRIGNTSGYMALQARTDAGAGARDLLLLQHSTGNTGLLSSTSFGGGVKVIAVADATTIPTTNPTGGGIMYSEAGALKWRGPSGAVTTIGAA